MIEMTKEQITKTSRTRKFLKEKSISITCERVSAIVNLDIIELYLLLSRVKNWEWKDPLGGVKPRQKGTRIVINILRDFLVWPFLYYSLRRQTTQNLATQKRTRSSTSSDNSILFLRTDHWFNIKSGGSVGHLSGVIDGFRLLGRKTRVVSTDLLVNVKQDDDFYVFPPSYGIGRNLPNFPEIIHTTHLKRFLLNKTKEWKPAFIYQRYSLGNFTGVLLSRALEIPYVCEYNGSFPWMARHWGSRKIFHEKLALQIEMLNLETATCIVVVSKPMQDELMKRGIAAHKILVNPNGVDPLRYSPHIDGTHLRKKHGLSNKIVLGFIGTFGMWHGAEVLAETFGMLLKQYPEYQERVRLLMIGDGKMMPKARAAIETYHVKDQCRFLGMVPQEDGPAHLAACDILVSPHVPNPDGTPFFGSPTKLFEYMAMGKPIVASDLDQIGEILEHKKTAYMVKPADKDALMHGIRTLIDDQELRDHVGKNARREAEEKYTWVQHTKRIIDKLHSLS